MANICTNYGKRGSGRGPVHIVANAIRFYCVANTIVFAQMHRDIWQCWMEVKVRSNSESEQGLGHTLGPGRPGVWDPLSFVTLSNTVCPAPSPRCILGFKSQKIHNVLKSCYCGH